MVNGIVFRFSGGLDVFNVFCMVDLKMFTNFSVFLMPYYYLNWIHIDF